MASRERFELPTDGLEGRCSIKLSYRDIIRTISILNIHDVVKNKDKKNIDFHIGLSIFFIYGVTRSQMNGRKLLFGVHSLFAPSVKFPAGDNEREFPIPATSAALLL